MKCLRISAVCEFDTLHEIRFPPDLLLKIAEHETLFIKKLIEGWIFINAAELMDAYLIPR